VLPPPILSVINQDFMYERMLAKVDPHWNGKPLDSLGGFNPVSFSPPASVVLNIIVNDKHVTPVKLFKKAKPGKIGGLKDDNRHSDTVSRRPHGMEDQRANLFCTAFCRLFRAPEH